MEEVDTLPGEDAKMPRSRDSRDDREKKVPGLLQRLGLFRSPTTTLDLTTPAVPDSTPPSTPIRFADGEPRLLDSPSMEPAQAARLPRGAAPPNADNSSEESHRHGQSLRASIRHDQFQGAIEEQIDRAQRRGDFDNLKGKGKPMDLREQPGEADGTWAIYRVTGGAGLQLPWIALAKEIDDDLAACRKIADRLPMATRLRRTELLEVYRNRARDAKSKIARYNLMAPNMQLQRLGVDAEGMIADVERTVEALNSR